jgi:hydroxymethylpyrimidine/phosphomethylpyrimidine kinase
MDPGSLVSSSLILHPVPYMRPFLSLPTAEAVMRIPTALTIAGSDSGGGAGIQADLKTFTLYGVYGMTAITAVTVQNTEGVFGVVELPPDVVAAQIDVVVRDIGVDAAKTGMLANAGIVQAVAEAVRRNGIERLVVDPVLRAKSGDPLLRPEAERALIEDLLPLAWVVTPNLSEAERLAGFPVRTRADMERAARAIRDLGPRAVVVKGGHLEEGATADDLLYDGATLAWLKAPRIRTRHTHGTGCTFSAAIAAGLARGWDLRTAVEKAKTFVTRSLQRAPGLGHGHGPLNHMWSGRIPWDKP